MFIHGQNSDAPRSLRCAGRREAHSRGPGPNTRNSLCRVHLQKIEYLFKELGRLTSPKESKYT
jgi:hypothetical protein